jgi:hypothetical protein
MNSPRNSPSDVISRYSMSAVKTGSTQVVRGNARKIFQESHDRDFSLLDGFDFQPGFIPVRSIRSGRQTQGWLGHSVPTQKAAGDRDQGALPRFYRAGQRSR